MADVVDVADDVLLVAQTLAKVVYQTGIVVLGDGPQEYISTATVAPAAAPTAIVYSATAANSQSPSSVAVVPLTCNRKSAT